MRWEVAVSERRACGLIEIYRRTYRATARGPATAGAVARAGRRAAKVRISPIDAKVGAGRMEGESQAPVPAVRRRKAGPSPEAGPMPTRRIAAGVAAEADSSRSLDPVNAHCKGVDQIETQVCLARTGVNAPGAVLPKRKLSAALGHRSLPSAGLKEIRCHCIGDNPGLAGQ